MGNISGEGLGSQSSNFMCRFFDLTQHKMSASFEREQSGRLKNHAKNHFLGLKSFRNSYLNTISDVLNINNYFFIKKLSNFFAKKHCLICFKVLDNQDRAGPRANHHQCQQQGEGVTDRKPSC